MNKDDIPEKFGVFSCKVCRKYRATHPDTKCEECKNKTIVQVKTQ